MSKQYLRINDFNLFLESLSSFVSLVEKAKLSFDSNGMTIYGKNSETRVRGELTTNSVQSDKPVSISFQDATMLIKLLSTAKSLHENDESEIKLCIDLPFFRIETPKFKTKVISTDESIISQAICDKIKTPLTPVFEFTTSSFNIKSIMSHSFIFPDEKSIRVYLRVEPEMENNVLYATIGNEVNSINNSVTLKFAMINSGTIGDRKIIVNFSSLKTFNIVKSDAIKIQLMDKNVLVCKNHVLGKNDSYYDFDAYCSMLAE